MSNKKVAAGVLRYRLAALMLREIGRTIQRSASMVELSRIIVLLGSQPLARDPIRIHRLKRMVGRRRDMAGTLRNTIDQTRLQCAADLD
jgi:hypothetical protein